MPGPDLARELTSLDRTRELVAAQDRAIEETRIERAALVAERDSLLAAGDAARAETVSTRLETADTTIRDLLGRRGDLLGEVAGVSDRLADRFTPEVLTATLDGRHPVAMLPVRIETRYDGPTRLRVRIFPDQVHLDAHDPALTADEVDGATWYWTQRWQAGLDDREAAGLAWRGLSSRFRPGRAAYIVQAMRPTNAPPDAAPAFPTPDARESTWSRAPVATALPDRFCVVGLARQDGGWVERFRQWGSHLPDQLAVGPSPRSLQAGADGKLPVDEDTLWLRDPQRAKDQGALIEVEHPSLAGGVERLVVLGVDWTLTPEQAAASLGTLLTAQRYAGQLGFVGQGTPTNNTSEARAGFAGDPNAEAAALDPYDGYPAGDDWSAGRRLAAALGLAEQFFDDVPGARLREHAWASALTDVLWRATAGYYVSEMLDPLAKGKPEIDADLREFARRNLFAAGPLPTLRVDDQPYGVLPVVSMRSYDPGLGRAPELVHRVATVMRDIVRPAIGTVPHLRRAGEDQDVDAVLLALLQRTPVPWTLRFRAITGPVERKNLSLHWDLINAWQRTWTSAMWVGLGTYTSTRLNELTLGKDYPLPVPLVLRPGDDPSKAPAYLTEIAALLADPHGRQALNLRSDSIALLEALAACSAVQELDRAALVAVRDKFRPSAELLATLPALANLSVPTPGLVRVEAPPSVPPPALDFRSGRQLADAVVPEVSVDKPLGEYVGIQLADKLVDIAALRDAPTDPFYWLGEQHEALDQLAAAPPDQLEWAFRGYLDLFSTRLDAWFTALATERLAGHRSRTPEGVHLGCWGFVEDLHRDVGAAGESLGFVHAPSLAHAVSTALLRNGRLANRGDDGSVFDLQITSERVRRAQWILEGVAQGQRLAALLGYRIERLLRETDLQLMRYQMPMRRVAPLRDLSRPADEPIEVLAARDVVDGVALLDRFRTDPDGLLDAVAAAAGPPAVPGTDRARLRSVLAAIADSYDAVSDLLLAESVHQAAVGNLERSGAALAAHDRHGAAQDLDYIGSPRSGHTIAHRVGIALQDTKLADGWTRDARGTAEPRLDAWMSRLLGDPADWVLGAVLEAGDGTQTVLDPITLADLRLGPLSVALATQRPAQDGPSELEQRLALAFADRVAPDPDSRILLQDQAPVAAATGGLGDLLTLGTWLAKVTGGSPLTAGDFVSGADVSAGLLSPGTVDLADLATRITAVRSLLEDTAVALTAASSPAAKVKALLAATPYDGPDALPRVPANHPDAATVLTEQVAEVSARLVAAASAVAEAVAAPLPEGDEQVAARHTAVLRSLLGQAQPVLPQWALAAPASAAASLDGRADLLQGDPTAPATWLQRSALVRPELDPFAGLLTYAEAGGADVASQLRVVQLPHRPGASWHALPFVEPDPARPKHPPHGSVGLVLHSWSGFDAGKAFAGIMVDGWTETVPADTETTAVTFHYDAPGARAPQAILLAVHPEVSPERWSFDLLLDTVNEAADLAQLRTLSAVELAPMGSFLPALYLPDDYTRDVPSVPFKDLIVKAAAAGFVQKYADVLGKA